MQNGAPQDNSCALTPRFVWTNTDFVMGHETVPMGTMKSNVSLLHRMSQLQAASHTTQKVNTWSFKMGGWFSYTIWKKCEACTESFLTGQIRCTQPWEKHARNNWTCFMWYMDDLRDCWVLYYARSILQFILYDCHWTCKWLTKIWMSSLCVSVNVRSLECLLQ